MDFSSILNNNLRDHLVVSAYNKDALKGKNLVIGIDEAGRGPVLGPMVYGAFFCPLDEESKLTDMECADSKTLTEEARVKILEKLDGEKDFCGYALKVLSPHTISTGMLKRDKYNLNELSHDTAMSLVDEIYTNQKLNIGHVYLDTVGDPLKYEAKLKARFPKLNFKVSKKADSIYPCVSAASICAKVTRDNILKNWIFNEKIDVVKYGSGYPGDPETKKFLNNNLDKIFGFVKLVRFSWSTSALKVNMKCVTIVYNMDEDFDENEDGSAKPKVKKGIKTKSKSETNDTNSLSILNFFAQKPKKRNYSTIENSEFLIKKSIKFAIEF